jgi:hypothetical protein
MTPSVPDAISRALKLMRDSPASVRFSDLKRVCDFHFGTARQRGTSHLVYKMPWAGDPRVNIQNAGGRAKPYQARQVLLAIERLIRDRASAQ